MTTYLETPHVTFEIKDWLLYCTYHPPYKITLKEAKKIVQTRLAFTEARSYPVIIFGTGIIQMDWNARRYLSSAEGTEGLTAAAIVVSSPVIQMLGNFMIRSTPAAFKARLLSSEEKAIQWLSHIAQSKNN